MKQEIQTRLKDKLLHSYVKLIPEYPIIFQATPPIIDHYAIIDLPSAHSGIPHLKTVFEMAGLKARGHGYLPEKQNDFLWMADPEFEEAMPATATPQVVVADFRKSELSTNTRKIIEKYASYPSLESLSSLPNDVGRIADALAAHLNTRPWPQPSLREYLSVNEENPLLAWVLLFGRRVNHFGVGIYAMEQYRSFTDFTNCLQEKHQIQLNPVGGIIKGNQACGIEQSSTIGATRVVSFDGMPIQVNDCFLEFVWRHPATKNPIKMRDYYLDFLPANANKVVESLYL